MAIGSKYFILEGQVVKPVYRVEDWALWMSTNPNTRIAKTEGDGYIVSTVFIGLDHNYGGGPPEIFETMVFKQGEATNLDCERCGTYKQALKNHEYYVKQYIGLQEKKLEETKEVKKVKNFTDDIEE